MLIYLFHRKSDEKKVKRLHVVEFLHSTATDITFQSLEWILPEIERHYYVRLEEAPEGQPERFEEIAIYNKNQVKPPYIYTAPRLGEWRGFAENVEPEKKEE